MEVRVIQDPIHGNIQVDEWLVGIIDTPQFQRLRRIKQLGFANLVYPGANHTRFEHSIGTMFVAKELAAKISADDSTREEIIAAAIIHDIGHPPFSHTTEKILEKYLGISHDNVGNLLKASEIKSIITEKGLRFQRVIDHVMGKSGIDIVSGDIDADRMDYLVRDSYYTGVAYGLFDLMRLINKIYFEDSKLVIDSGGLRAAESLLISRFMMYPTVYFHHVCRISEKMYERALGRCFENELLSPEMLLKMDDCSIVSFLRSQDGFVRDMIERIDSRRLMKRAIYVGLSRIGIDISKLNPYRAESEIAEESHVDPDYVFVDIPPPSEVRELNAMVNVDGELIKLEDASPLISALKTAQKDVWKVGVYTRKDYVEKVARVSASYFEIERIPRQKKLDEVLPIW